MKKWIILALLLTSTPCFGFNQKFLQSLGGGCSASSNEVGSRSTGNHNTMVTDYVSVFPATADCSGALGYAKIFQKNAPYSTNVKIAVFPRTGAPDAANEIIGSWTGAIALGSSADTWIPSGTTATITGNVTAGDYWIAVVVSGDSSIGCTSGTGAYYRSCSGCYASPPTTLTGTWTSDSYSSISAYVTIGN